MPSGKPIPALSCTVLADAAGELTIALDYLSEGRDPMAQHAEAVAIVGEMTPDAERFRVQRFAFHSFRRHWTIRRGRVPSLAEWTSTGYFFDRCDDARWIERGACTSSFRPSASAAHLGDGTSADPRVILCGAPPSSPARPRASAPP
jgi:hypothetical protein